MAGYNYTIERKKGTWSKHVGLDRSQICLYCKNRFTTYPHRIGVVKFCSIECRNESYKAIKRIKTGEYLKCLICSSKFYCFPSDDRKFCSKSCADIGRDKSKTTGTKHWNWKGGITDPSQSGRKLLKYKNWRQLVFERDDYTCQFCQDRGVELNADHIKPWSLYPELRYDVNNGRTLCKDCHKKTDTYGGKIFKYNSTS